MKRLKKVKQMFGVCPLCKKNYSDISTHLYYDFCLCKDEDLIREQLEIQEVNEDETKI